jgi:5-methylcytosine-specific restriction endonuclease McrA
MELGSAARPEGHKRPRRRLAEAGAADRDSLPLGPNGLPLCRWCQLEILSRRRRTFCSDYCVHAWRLRSDPGYLRDKVYARDKGVCAACALDTVAAYGALRRSRGHARAEALAMWGLRSVTARRSLWDADHVRPVAEGGGECDLENLRTLCLMCHREATAELRRRLKRAGATAAVMTREPA